MPYLCNPRFEIIVIRHAWWTFYDDGKAKKKKKASSELMKKERGEEKCIIYMKTWHTAHFSGDRTWHLISRGDDDITPDERVKCCEIIALNSFNFSLSSINFFESMLKFLVFYIYIYISGASLFVIYKRTGELEHLPLYNSAQLLTLFGVNRRMTGDFLFGLVKGTLKFSALLSDIVS